MRSIPTLVIVSPILALAATPALAHTGGPASTGLMAGFLHPLGGLDHVLAMVTVGALAAIVGGRALWAVPFAFLVVMTLGAVAAGAGAAIPLVEIGIAGSVVALGLAVTVARSLSAPLAVVLASAFAVFHGHAHGAEMPAALSGLGYGAGFLVATALLHGAGLAATVLATRALAETGGRAIRLAGAASATAGLAMVAGAL